MTGRGAQPDYGPGGTRIRELIARCRSLTPAELGRLQEVLETDFIKRTDEARVAAVRTVETAGRSEAWAHAMRAVGDAVEASVSARRASDLSGAVFAVPAWVALALIAGDRLAAEHQSTLVQGWLDARMPLP